MSALLFFPFPMFLLLDYLSSLGVVFSFISPYLTLPARTISYSRLEISASLLVLCLSFCVHRAMHGAIIIVAIAMGSRDHHDMCMRAILSWASSTCRA